MIVRYASAIAIGTFVTGFLLFLMQSLIDIQPSAVTEEPPRRSLVWAEARPPESLKTNDRPDVVREELTKTLLPPLRDRLIGDGSGVSFDASDPGKPANTFSMPDLVPTDGPLVAIVRVAPEYLMRANGREGYVIVKFDVMSNGRVANTRVVESSDGIFEKAALKAAQRSRYRARVVDGLALISVGVQTLYRFEMESN